MATEMLTKDEHRAPQVHLRAPGETRDHPAAISVSGLVKRFGATRALDGLDLTVRRGEVHDD